MLNLIIIFAVTALAFGLVISLMSVGVMMGRRAIQGSCGGLGSRQGEQGGSSCSLCSNQDSGCRDLRRNVRNGTQGHSLAGASPSKADNCELDCQVEGCTDEQIEACKH